VGVDVAMKLATLFFVAMLPPMIGPWDALGRHLECASAVWNFCSRGLAENIQTRIFFDNH
jgi:hypothetical protein